QRPLSTSIGLFSPRDSSILRWFLTSSLRSASLASGMNWRPAQSKPPVLDGRGDARGRGPVALEVGRTGSARRGGRRNLAGVGSVGSQDALHPLAVFFVKVVARIDLGGRPATKIRYKVLRDRQDVFPVPGPATINKLHSGGAYTASACSLSGG